MEEKIEFYKNDTVRHIDQLLTSIKLWQKNGGYARPRETALVITKLEEAKFWALLMVERDEDGLPTNNNN